MHRKSRFSIQAVKKALMENSQDLINNLFDPPYTKVEFIERDLKVSRLTATKYLAAHVKGGFLIKQKIGRSNYYINPALTAILTGDSMRSPGS